MKSPVFRRKLSQRIVIFLIVGGVGFVTDGGILTLLTKATLLGPYFSRAISFPIAVSVTWYLNRHLTFVSENYARKGPEYVRYMMIQIIGAVINFVPYSLLIALVPSFASIPILPFAIGSLLAMIFNFLGMHFFVFRRPVSNQSNPPG
ncbi:MAG: GtrA family protein [Dehalococcoidales bacterium]|nr:GtrA family protein [Dehalococcoidales bacterium]